MDELDQELTLSMMNIECFPVLDINYSRNHYVQFPLSSMSLLGGAFTMLPTAVQTATKTNSIGKQLFEALIPNNGELVRSKGGEGFRSMVRDPNTKKFVKGHADFVPKDDVIEMSTTLTVDPSQIASAMAMITISMQISEVKETSDDIIAFLDIDKQTHLKANILALTDILSGYKHNLSNEQFVASRNTLALNIKKDAEADIMFYKEFIENKLNRQMPIHLGTEKTINEIQVKFRYYQLALYLYAFSSFVETILLGNFNEDYLKSISRRIREYSLEYRFFYSKTYETLEKYVSSSAQSVLLSGVSGLGKIGGETADRISAFKKTQIGSNLRVGSDKIKQLNDNVLSQTMSSFISNKDSNINSFADRLDTLSKIYNHPMHILFDDDNVYLDVSEASDVI